MRMMITTLALTGLFAAAGFAADAKAGQGVYNTSCKSCHGADGTPNAGVAKMMKVDMKDLKSAEIQAMSDDDIKSVITGGKGKMKPVSSVTGASVNDVVAYVRSLKK
jgi:mono/diheme cytochrome c family protein